METEDFKAQTEINLHITECPTESIVTHKQPQMESSGGNQRCDDEDRRSFRFIVINSK